LCAKRVLMNQFAHTKEEEFIHTFNPKTWGRVTGVIFFDTRRVKKDNHYPVKIKITFKRDRKYINTGFSLSVDEWKRIFTAIKDKNLIDIRNKIQAQYKVIGDHISLMVEKGNFSFDLLDKRLGRGDKNNVIDAFEARISELRKKGQVGTAVTYSCAMNSLIKHNDNNKVLPFSCISKSWLEGYEQAMIDSGNRYTTISIYLRSLRAIFNFSEINYSPFGKKEDSKYEIPKGSGRKLALSREQINEILMRYPVIPGSTTDKMRDLWYFSFMANGLNVKDLIGLKWGDINYFNDEIEFERAKTIRTKRDNKGRKIKAPILPEMSKIIEKWGCKESKYIFGYLQDNLTPDETRIVCQNVTRLINKHISAIAKEVGLPHISTYTARHSYASILLQNDVGIEFISEQLGHADIRTTQSYLAGFDSNARRKYNETLTQG
jgi:integrase/recombinase XerD